MATTIQNHKASYDPDATAEQEGLHHTRVTSRARKREWGPRVLLAIATLLTASIVAWATPASASKPTIERFSWDETFIDEEVTDACGVEVTAHVQGDGILRSFDRSGPGLHEVWTINETITLTAGDNSYRLKNVGADVTRATPDGTAVLLVIGQLPFQYTGVRKINLDTGEVILEPVHRTDGDLDRACEVLTS